MHRYRSVLVGCGGRGQSHALGLLANPDRFELVALCDQDDARLGALAAKLGISRGYADAEAMLAAERPDVLCFATPPAVRLELVELGVRHGVKAIAFEKPLALSLAEARRIVTLCGDRVKAVLCLGAGARATWVLGQAHGRAAYLEDHPCPDHVAGIVELSTGVRGVMEIGSLAPRHLDEADFWEDVAVTVQGSEGYARVVLGSGWEAVTRRSEGRT